MAITQLRGNTQLKDASVTVAKLATANGASWTIAGDNLGVIDGLGTPTGNNQAVNKGYVDGLIDTSMKSPDGYAPDAGGNYPSDYKGTGSVNEGDSFYIISVASGTAVGTASVNVGDLLVALVDNPGNTDANWVIMETNRDQANETVKGVAEIATQVETDLGTDDERIITPLKLSTYLTNAGIAPGQAQNGLTQNGNFTELGGILNRNTDVVGDFNLSIRSTDNSFGDYGVSFSNASARARLNGYSIGNTENYVETASGSITLYSDNNVSGGGNVASIVMDASDWINVRTDNSNGIQYVGDYSANNAANPRWIVDKGYVDGAITGATTTAGAGLTDTAGTYDVVATDASLLVAADSVGVQIGSTNGDSLEVTATGLELASNVTGDRTFSNDNFTVTSTTTATLGAPVNGAVLTSQPDGTVDLAIASIKYVKDAVGGNDVYSELPIVTNNSPTVNIAAPAVAGTERVYLNGARMSPGAGNDYTVTGTSIDFTFNLVTGDTVLVDYKQA